MNWNKEAGGHDAPGDYSSNQSDLPPTAADPGQPHTETTQGGDKGSNGDWASGQPAETPGAQASLGDGERQGGAPTPWEGSPQTTNSTASDSFEQPPVQGAAVDQWDSAPFDGGQGQDELEHQDDARCHQATTEAATPDPSHWQVSPDPGYESSRGPHPDDEPSALATATPDPEIPVPAPKGDVRIGEQQGLADHGQPGQGQVTDETIERGEQPQEISIHGQQVAENSTQPGKPRSRSVATERGYASIVDRRYLSSQERRTDPKDRTDLENRARVEPIDVVTDFLEDAGKMAASTVRVVRSALLWYMRGESDKHPAYQRAYDFLVRTCLAQQTTLRCDHAPWVKENSIELGNSPARKETTEREYEIIAHRRYRFSEARRTTNPEDRATVSPIDVVTDFLIDAEQQAASTFRTTRAALLWYMANNRSKHPLYQEAYDILARTRFPPGPGPDGKPRSAGRRGSKKTIPEKDYHALVQYLDEINRKSNAATRVKWWLIAGMASGARPGEWEYAHWQDDKQEILCLRTSKRRSTVPVYLLTGPGQTIHDIEAEHPEWLAKPDDGDRTVRNIPIEDDMERTAITLHLRAVRLVIDADPDNPDAFKDYFNACRKFLWGACKSLFKGKRMYSLYIMRSQFAANKKAEKGLEEVAELMGHSTTRHTMGSYGARWKAHKSPVTDSQKSSQRDGERDGERDSGRENNGQDQNWDVDS